jgi:hypothetical protein
MATNNESVGPLIQNHEQDEKRSVQFLALCIILTAMLFILIDAVAYFTASTDTAPRGTKTF